MQNSDKRIIAEAKNLRPLKREVWKSKGKLATFPYLILFTKLPNLSQATNVSPGPSLQTHTLSYLKAAQLPVRWRPTPNLGAACPPMEPQTQWKRVAV